MADIFTDLKNALAPYVGGADAAGWVLGGVLTLSLLIAIEWALKGGSVGSRSTFIMSAGLGIALSTLFGWFPLWVVVFIASVLVVLLIAKPFGGGVEGD